MDDSKVQEYVRELEGFVIAYFRNSNKQCMDSNIAKLIDKIYQSGFNNGYDYGTQTAADDFKNELEEKLKAVYRKMGV